MWIRSLKDGIGDVGLLCDRLGANAHILGRLVVKVRGRWPSPMTTSDLAFVQEVPGR